MTTDITAQTTSAGTMNDVSDTSNTLTSSIANDTLPLQDDVETYLHQIMEQGSNVIENASAIVKQSTIAKEQVDYLSQQTNELIHKIDGVQEQITAVSGYASNITNDMYVLSTKLIGLAEYNKQIATGCDPFILSLTIFTLACVVGYYVVWNVTPALHTPLMSLTNSVSGIIIIGALLGASASSFSFSSAIALLAVFIAAINIFGGFVVTERMIEMFKPGGKRKSSNN